MIKRLKIKNILIAFLGLWMIVSIPYFFYQQGVIDEKELTNRALKLVHAEHIATIEELEADILAKEKQVEELTDTLEYLQGEKDK